MRVRDCEKAAKIMGNATFVEVTGNGIQLPNGCIWDQVNVRKAYVYWNKKGAVNSLDPNLRLICEE